MAGGPQPDSTAVPSALTISIRSADESLVEPDLPDEHGQNRLEQDFRGRILQDDTANAELDNLEQF